MGGRIGLDVATSAPNRLRSLVVGASSDDALRPGMPSAPRGASLTRWPPGWSVRCCRPTPPFPRSGHAAGQRPVDSQAGHPPAVGPTSRSSASMAVLRPSAYSRVSLTGIPLAKFAKDPRSEWRLPAPPQGLHVLARPEELILVGARRRGLETGPSISCMLTMSLRRWGAWAIVADGLVWLADGLITREFAPSYWSPTRLIDYVPSACTAAACCYWRSPWPRFMCDSNGGVACSSEWRSRRDRRRDSRRCGRLRRRRLRFAEVAWVFFGGMLLLGAGLLLFGIATVLARVLPVACGGLLLLSLGIAYPLGGLWSNWGGTVVFGLVWITLGCVLMLDKSQNSLNVDIRR